MEDYPKQQLDKKWLIEGITPPVVKWADSFGKYLCVKEEPKLNDRLALTTGQLRKFFGEVKRIDANYERNKDDIVMLKPLLAYAVGRDMKSGKNKTRIKEFNDQMTKAIDGVIDNPSKEKFSNFVKLFEAIVAYHKYYGGQENKNK